MSILFSGDFHSGEAGELGTITKQSLRKKFKPDKFNDIKYHIILGDGGFLWPGNQKTDLLNYETLAFRPFPILCVVGNHDPILGMSNLAETDIGIGETVYKINDVPFVAYLKRGKVYFIDGFKFLVLGGALSIDKAGRIAELSWWKEEYWSEKEKQDLFNLLKRQSSFDFVISHTGPESINNTVFAPILVRRIRFIDEVALLNDDVLKQIQFNEWWCGHWHRDLYYYDEASKRGYQYLYRTAKILDKVQSKFVVYNEYNMTKR